MTTIVINAISVKEGGSLVALQNLLEGMVLLRPEWQWHVATNSEAHARLPDLHNTVFHVFPERVYAGWKVRLWYETGLPRLARQVKADLLFSQTNYLPMRKLPCPTLLLVQHAGHFSEVFKHLTEAQLARLPARLIWRLKGRWVKSSIQRAQSVTVQTRALARRITEETGVPRERVCVIPHGIGQAILHDHLPPSPVAGQPVRVGYITKYGVQKNFAVLFAAAARLQSLGITPVLVLTLAPRVSENQAVFECARQYGVAELIENNGELSAPEINALYRTLHLFVFPSLCESFGFPMVEALAHGLPLLVADIDANIEVAGKAGLTFPPNDGHALAALIYRLIEDPAWHQACALASHERAAHFTWHKAAAATLERMDRMLWTPSECKRSVKDE